MLPNGSRSVGHSKDLPADGRSVSVPLWVIGLLILIAFSSRISAALILPNAEQDGYSYAEIISRLTQCLEAGQLSATDLYGFWLPLFQVAAAILNLGVHDALVAGKIINAICGAIATVLVFDLTLRLTRSVLFAAIGFAVILIDPLHLLFSAACMTDVPHACLVLTSLWFAARRKWIAAAITGGLAGFIRIESWSLLVVLPILQLLCERRVSIVTVLVLLLAPLGWLTICFAATGHPLSYFHDRAQYHIEYIAAHPERHGFHWTVLCQDLDSFLTGAGRLITVVNLAVTIGVMWRWVRDRKLPNPLLLITIGYYISLMGLIVVAYVTKAQPVILPRYGLTFFAIGLPLFAWSLQFALARLTSPFLKVILTLIVGAVLFAEMGRERPTLGNVYRDFRAHQKIASALVQKMGELPDTRCFSDDVAVRVLSGLPPDRFLRTVFARRSGVTTKEEFSGYLRDHDGRFLVFFPTEDSLPVKFFPELGRNELPNDSRFELLDFASSSFGPDIWLYRVR